jgi:hypothetical protein
VIDGDPWEELKGGRDQVEILTNPADAGIRVKAFDNRILIPIHC